MTDIYKGQREKSGGEAAVEVQVVDEVAIVLHTTPIEAIAANIVERAVYAVAIACGRQKNRIPGSFICKFSAGYTILSYPFIAHFVSVKQCVNFI